MSDYCICDCGYKVDLLDVLNKKVEVLSHPVDEFIETVCQECGHAHVKEAQVWHYVCPDCGKDLIEVYEAEENFGGDEIQEGEPKTFNIAGRNYSKPLISDSLAINPDQIVEHREKFPDITVLADGRLQFENFRQHDNYLKKTGFNKMTQRKKSVGKTLGGKVVAKINRNGKAEIY